MLSQSFTAYGCSTDQTICSRAQPSCGPHTGEWETDNNGKRIWLSDVNDAEQWDWEEENATHFSLHASHWRIPYSFSLFCSFIFILTKCFIVPTFASVICLPTDQRLDLNKLSPNDSDTVRGQIVGEYRFACANLHLVTQKYFETWSQHLESKWMVLPYFINCLVSQFLQL